MLSVPWSRTLSPTFSGVCIHLLALVLITGAAGCGSGNGNFSTQPKLSGNTKVTVLVSSAANDQLSQFNLDLKTLTLTSQSGRIVRLLSADMPFETIHINGEIEPAVTVSIPQDVYTSAAATVGAADFTCVALTPLNSPGHGGLDISTYAYGYTPDSMVTVSLPSQITVTGDSMALSLDLQVLQSVNYSSCIPAGGAWGITPTFNLTALALSPHPTNPGNGKVIQANGRVSNVATSGNTFTLSVNEGGKSSLSLSISTDNNTEYQGIPSFSALQVGTFVDIDGALQRDGSLIATRIASYDTAALNVMTGPVLFMSNTTPNFYNFPRQQQGQDYSTQPFGMGVYSYAGTTLFQVSGQLGNLTSLPFVASFNKTNMVPGQNVAVYSGAITGLSGGQTTTATTITLMPQTVDGNVVSSSTSGGFSIYTVELAPDSLFPTVAVQPGQTTLLTNPNSVDVYIDANTQKLNTISLSAGNTLRFYGLIFNDNGALRMDCAQISDGVPFSAPVSSSRQVLVGDSQSFVHKARGSEVQVIRTVRSSR
jgi:uncharacterized protein DUF5666